MKNQKGITLIALVITIIVLLILAGVSIAMLTGDNGLLNKTDKAKVTTIEARVDEEVRLAVQALRLEIANQAADDNSYNAIKHSKTLGDDLLDDLNLSKASDATYKVTANPANDDPSATSAKLTIEFTGTDYSNATKSTTAKITYEVTLSGQTVTLGTATITE